MTSLLVDVPHSVVERAARAMPGRKRPALVEDALTIAARVHEMPGELVSLALCERLLREINSYIFSGERDFSGVDEAISRILEFRRWMHELRVESAED